MRDGWTETTLGDIADVIGGGTPSTTKPEYWGGEIVWLTPTEVVPRDGQLIADSERRITTEGLKNSGAQLLPAGSVILTTRASVGFVGISGVELATNQGFQSLVPSDEVLSKFLMYWIQANRAEFESRAAGSTFKEISRSNVKSIKMQLPTLAEQRRIVDVVSSVDNYIDALQQQADVARNARNAVLHELLSAGGDDWTETTVSTLLSRSIGGVWGTEPGTDQEDVTVVRSTEFTKSGILNFATGEPRSIRTSQLSSRVLAEGDILLEKSGGGPEQPVGRVVYVQSDIPSRFVCSNFIQLLTPIRQKVLPRFLFLVMWMWHFENRTLEFQAQTTGIRNLRTPDYLDQCMALPPLSEQQRIVAIVSSMDDVIQSTEQAVVKAQSLRSGLLSDLLSGEHEIPESYDRLLGAA